MIKSLELINWRTHSNTLLNFGEGTNVIIGVMGSGKSSIVNALSYSLFGTFPALKSKQISLTEIIMNKPTQKEFTETKLIFEHKKDSYLVERIIKDTKTNEAKLYKNNTLIAGPKQKDVNENIEKILGLNYELFSRAVYAEQNELDFFLKLTPSERKRKFDELLDLEKYETTRRNTLTLKNSLTKENKQKQEFIEKQKETLKTHEEENLIEKIEKTKNEIKEIETNKNKINEQIKEISILLKKEEDKEIINQKLLDYINRAKSKIETLKENLLKTKDFDLKKIEIELTKTKSELKLKQEEKVTIKKQKEEFEKVKVGIGEETKVLDYRINDLEKEEKNISKLEGNCPTCKQKMDLKHKETLLQKITIDKKEITSKKTLISTKQEELVILINELKEQENLITKEIEEKQKLTYNLENDLKRAIEIEKQKEETTLLEKELPLKEEELKKLDFNKTNLDNVKQNYFETKSKINIFENELKTKIELKKNYENNLEKVELIKKNIELFNNELLISKQAVDKLGMFENCLISTQSELRETMLDTINQAMSQIWDTLYPYGDFVDARLQVVDNGYDLQVQTRTNIWTRVEGILSGGERSAAALCIRIAFALVLTKQLSMLILDEPTHNLDSNSIEKLSLILRDSLPELVGQTFVITHDKQMESAATSNLYKLNRNKDIDQPTMVEVLEII